MSRAVKPRRAALAAMTSDGPSPLRGLRTLSVRPCHHEKSDLEIATG